MYREVWRTDWAGREGMCQDGDILHHWQRLPWERWIIQHHFNYVLSWNENSQDLMLLFYKTSDSWFDWYLCFRMKQRYWSQQRKNRMSKKTDKNWISSECDGVGRKKMTWSQSPHHLSKNSNNFVRVNVQNSSWRPPGPPGKRKTGSGNRIWRVLMTSVFCWQVLASLPNSVVCESSETGRFQSLERWQQRVWVYVM